MIKEAHAFACFLQWDPMVILGHANTTLFSLMLTLVEPISTHAEKAKGRAEHEFRLYFLSLAHSTHNQNVPHIPNHPHGVPFT